MFSTHLLISGILAILTVPSRLAESVAAHRPITRSMHSFELRNGAMHAATNSVSHMEDHSYWAGAVYDSFTAVCTLAALCGAHPLTCNVLLEPVHGRDRHVNRADIL